MLSDLEIAQRAKLKPIIEIATALGIEEEEIELYGKHKAKIVLSVLKRLAARRNGKYVDVTALTPTPLGEGKTTTTIGLSLDPIARSSLSASKSMATRGSPTAINSETTCMPVVPAPP